MKKQLATILCLLLCLSALLSFTACTGIEENASSVAESSEVVSTTETPADSTSADLTSAEESKEQLTGLWAAATYTADTTFGNGATTVTVQVKAEDKTVSFTVKTDKKTLGDALLEHDLIAGDQGAYGLYVKKVNGITADYDVDQSYWAFYKGGEMMMVGVDGAEIKDGEGYELVYTKS